MTFLLWISLHFLQCNHEAIDVTILADCSYVCYNVLIIIARFKYKNVLRLNKFYGGLLILVSNLSKDAGRLEQNNGYKVVLD